MKGKLLTVLAVVVILSLGLAACGPTPTPVPTDTPTPVPPTDTPVPPTDTPVPPTDTPVPLADTARLEEELAQLLAPDEAAFILHEVSRITPPERIKELDRYPERQSEQGGGFFGILPRQLEMDAVPIPDSDTGVLRAAIALARQRSSNLAAIAELDPGYPFSFRGSAIPDWPYQSIPGMSLHLDLSAIHGFLEAYGDSDISLDEASALVRQSTTQEMLRHRDSLSYMPSPKVTESSLTSMIARAGSSDPLDKIWNWLHPMNNFGYADLAINAEEYSSFVEEVALNGQRLTHKVVSNVGEFAPDGVVLNETYGFTVGFFIRGWATDKMPGLNIEQYKDDWEFLQGILTHETYHRLQLSLCPMSDGRQARTFEDLGYADLGDRRFDKLYALLAYTVLEGSANRAMGDNISQEIPENVTAGIQLIDEFVARVVLEEDLSAADDMIAGGLVSNGPLYSLGWYWAGLIAEEDGTQAVGELLQEGPVAFALRASELATRAGESTVSTDTRDAIQELDELLAR
jgi:hypothetical protein